METILTERTADEGIKEIIKQTNLQHIAIIMDGNRRWAKLRNLPTAMGHKKGVDALKNKPLKYFSRPLKDWSLSEEDEKIIDELVKQKLK